MKRRAVALILGVMLCFCGCSDMFSGYYYSEEPHLHSTTVSGPSYTVRDVGDVCEALRDAVSACETALMIVGEDMGPETLDSHLRQAYLEVLEYDPLAAYALQGVSSKAGQVDGKDMLTVSLAYRFDAKYLLNIQTVQTMDDVAEQIRSALDRCDGSLVLYVAHFEEWDVAQIVEEHASGHPCRVMEMPRVLAEAYPYTGEARVVDVTFNYTMDRDSLKRMQTLVAQSIDQILGALPKDASDLQVYEILWTQLREMSKGRYDSSVTPAYSLLRHGVGDSKAYALVYGALCERLELPCQVVRGTKDGQGHCWVVIWPEEGAMHLDLLSEAFLPCTDGQMEGYVWDLDQVPACPESV